MTTAGAEIVSDRGDPHRRLLTFNNADQIAAWAKSFGKKITDVYITHGHSDHWLGLARLLEHFPEARGYAATEVVGRAAWEAEFNKTTKYWTSLSLSAGQRHGSLCSAGSGLVMT